MLTRTSVTGHDPLEPEAVDPVGDLRARSRPAASGWVASTARTSSSTAARSASGRTATWLTDATRCTTPSGVIACAWRNSAVVRARRSRAGRANALSRQFVVVAPRRALLDPVHDRPHLVDPRRRCGRARSTPARRAPPGAHDARAARRPARSWSNQCHACATVTASSDASRNGSASAVAGEQRDAGQHRAERRAHPGDGFGRDQVGAGRRRAAGSACRCRPRGRRPAGPAPMREVLDEPRDRVGRIRRPRRFVVGRVAEPRRRNLVHHRLDTTRRSPTELSERARGSCRRRRCRWWPRRRG